MYKPAQWILIDAASQYGKDKLLFDDRLLFGYNILEDIKKTDLSLPAIKSEFKDRIAEAENPEMFAKSLLALKDVLEGTPTGHIISLDAASSGPALLSILTGCVVGMSNTGCIGDTVPDLYNKIYEGMAVEGLVRAQVKKACVPFVYGSDYAPEAVFGDDADEFIAGYKKAVPMAYVARELLINSWNPTALYHEFTAPDGFIAHIEVRDTVDTIGKFRGQTYKYRSSVNMPKRKGAGTKSLAANVTHTYDAFVLRELSARCDYDVEQIQYAKMAIKAHFSKGSKASSLKLQVLGQLAEKFNFVSAEALSHVQLGCLANCSDKYLKALLKHCETMLSYSPFAIRTIHDDFGTSPVNVNEMKNQYNNILVESYYSTWLFDVIEHLSGRSWHHIKPACNPVVAEAIRTNHYAIH